MSVNDDGTGSFTAITALNAKFLEQFGGLSALSDKDSSVPSSGDVCKDITNDAKNDADLEGAKVEPYRDGDFCGVKVTAAFKNLNEAKDLIGGMSTSASGGLDDVVLEKAGAGYRFGATWQSTDATGTGSKESEAFAKQFLNGFSFVVRVKLPGGQVTQDADAITGDGTMVWNLDPLKGRKLTAQTDLSKPVITNKVLSDRGKSLPSLGGGSGGDKKSKTWLYVVGLLVVLAAIGGFILFKRSKSKAPAAAVAGIPGADPFGGYAPAAPAGPAPTAPVAPAPVAPAAPAPTAPVAPVPVAPVPVAPVAPTAAAADAPQWDPARNAYIQYDRVGGRWMQYDQAASAWRPIE